MRKHCIRMLQGCTNFEMLISIESACTEFSLFLIQHSFVKKESIFGNFSLFSPAKQNITLNCSQSIFRVILIFYTRSLSKSQVIKNINATCSSTQNIYMKTESRITFEATNYTSETINFFRHLGSVQQC